jgi:hypothetical protein
MLTILTACESIGQNSEDIGRSIIDSADVADETLNQNPGLEQVFPPVNSGVGLYRLAGEALLAFGLLLQTRRRKEAESAILEIDDAKDTPKARDQANSIQARKTIRKITG